MKIISLTCFALLAAACGPNIQRISLLDTRLPLEARRWLADSEDEVAIARAGLEDAMAELKRLRRYMGQMGQRIAVAWATGKAMGAGQKAVQAFEAYAARRLDMAERRSDAARINLKLALVRLHLAQAETAMRHDLAIYNIRPIVRDVDKQRAALVVLTRRVEELRTQVEGSFNALWVAYRQYVKAGGVTNALWLTGMSRAAVSR